MGTRRRAKGKVDWGDWVLIEEMKGGCWTVGLDASDSDIFI